MKLITLKIKAPEILKTVKGQPKDRLKKEIRCQLEEGEKRGRTVRKGGKKATMLRRLVLG